MPKINNKDFRFLMFEIKSNDCQRCTGEEIFYPLESCSHLNAITYFPWVMYNTVKVYYIFDQLDLHKN